MVRVLEDTCETSEVCRGTVLCLMTSRVSPPQGPLKGLPHGYVWSLGVHSFLTVLIIVPCSVRYTQGEVKATAADGLPPSIGILMPR